MNRLAAQLFASIAAANGSDAVYEANNAERLNLQSRVAKLGQIAAGLAVVRPEVLPVGRAGFGSRVSVINAATGASGEYTLTSEVSIAGGPGHLPLASPVGSALLGRKAGDAATIVIEGNEVTFLVTSVVTLAEILDDEEIG